MFRISSQKTSQTIETFLRLFISPYFAIFHIASVLINSHFPVQILQLKTPSKKENSNRYSQKSIQQNYLENLRALFPNVIIFQEEIKVGNDTISCCNWRNSKLFFFFFILFPNIFSKSITSSSFQNMKITTAN